MMHQLEYIGLSTYMEAKNLLIHKVLVPQTENPTSSSSNGPIEKPEITEQQVHRKCRAVVLHEFDCGLQVDVSEYHLGGIRLDEEVKKQVYTACKALSSGKGRKVARR
jgi:hypothetical protein